MHGFLACLIHAMVLPQQHLEMTLAGAWLSWPVVRLFGVPSTSLWSSDQTHGRAFVSLWARCAVEAVTIRDNEIVLFVSLALFCLQH